MIAYVRFITDYTVRAMGEDYGKKFAAYIGAILFIFSFQTLADYLDWQLQQLTLV